MITLIILLGDYFIDKGERARKSAIASSKRKAVRDIKKKRLNKLYRELRKARKK